MAEGPGGVQPGEKVAQGGHYCFLQPPERRLQPGETQFLLLCYKQGTKGNGLSLHQERFRFYVKKNSFPERVIKHWNIVPKEVVESQTLEVFRRHMDVALRNII